VSKATARSRVAEEAAESNPIERRKSTRAEVVVRVAYRTVDQLFSEFARNINEGGLFVESETPHPPGTQIALQFQLPGSEDPIQVRGRIVRSSDGSTGEPAGMGIEFDGLDDHHRQRINRLVRRLRAGSPVD
jgi:type IV pilus assembly protein PilZ